MTFTKNHHQHSGHSPRIDIDIACSFSVVNDVKVRDSVLVSDTSDPLISVTLSLFKNTFHWQFFLKLD